MLQPPDDAPPLASVLELVATQFTKGVIIWRTVYGNIIVGPTAEDTENREDRSNDEATIEMLKQVGRDRIPSLARAKVLGTYSGLRPATEHRDYQIHARDGEQWITVGGIRSTGLTGSSGIGEYVAGLYLGLSPALLRTVHGDAVSPPYASAPLYPVGQTNATVANLETLAADFQAHGDGTVEIYGRRHRVTHPLTAFGLASMRPVPQGPASTAAGQRT